MRDVCMLISIVAFLGLSGCSTPEEREMKEYFKKVYSESNDIEVPRILQEAEVVCLMHPYQSKVKLLEHIGIQDYINNNLKSKSFRVPEGSWYLLLVKNKNIFFYRHRRKEFYMVSPSGTGGIGDKWKNVNGYLAKDCVAYERAFLTVFFSDSNERRVGLVSDGKLL